MTPSAMARPLMSNSSSRLPQRPVAEERSSSMGLPQGIGNGVKGWGDGSNIWAQSFHTSRDASRSRDDPGLIGSKDTVNDKTPTNTFGPTLDTNVWNSRPRWESNGNNRSPVGISPVRRTSGVFSSEATSASQLFANNRSMVKPTNGIQEFSFGGQQSTTNGSYSNGPGHSARSSTESSQPLGSMSSWTDAGSIHSPTDDRKSLVNSDNYFAPSGGPSRNSSLPPSRNGESYMQLNETPFPGRFGSISGPSRSSHTPSLSSHSTGRYPTEHKDSTDETLNTKLNLLNFETQPSQRGSYERRSIGSQNNGLYNGHGASLHIRENDSPNQFEDAPGQAGEPFNSGNFPTFYNPFQRLQTIERGAFTPGTNDFRHPSYHSSIATPSTYATAYSGYSSRMDTGRPHQGAQPLLLERKLRGLQQEQAHALLPHAPYQPSMMNPYRLGYSMSGMNGFAPPFSMHNGLALSNLNPAMGIPSQLQGPSQSFPMLEPPRGPRDDDGMSLQSQLLVEFKAASKSNKQWQLKDIQGHVVEFCGDQLGSRFIQTKLETANSDDKQQLFSEMLPDIIQLMQDVFGNYVIQKFFDHGDQVQKGQIAAAMKGHVLELSTQMYACRVVQKAIDHILTNQQSALVWELEPNIIKCVKDMNGNHVIQRAIERIPGEHIQFIVDSFTGKVGELSAHAYGCRVIQRVLEFCTEPVKRTILTELHSCGSSLITDSYGNYVTQHMIAYGFLEDRERVIELVKLTLLFNSKHKFASNVVEKCLTFGSTQQRHDMLQIILNTNNDHQSGLSQLITDQFGNYVVQKMLDTLEGEDYRLLVERLQPELVKAKRTVSGKHIAAVEKKMHRNSRSNSLQPPTQSATTAGASPTPQISLCAADTTSADHKPFEPLQPFVRHPPTP